MQPPNIFLYSTELHLVTTDLFLSGAPTVAGLGGAAGGDECSRRADAGGTRESPLEGAGRHFGTLF